MLKAHLISWTIIFCIIHCLSTEIFAQARLIINNGAFINLSQGAQLVIENPAANAITRNTSGHIISEGENNIIKWNIGTTAASYVVPFGYGTTSYIPISFTTASAAGASGYISFATYHTNWDNSSQLPAGMTAFNNSSTLDNSAYVVDRFWQVDAQSYTTKPTLTNLVFTYLDAEYTGANSINESAIRAQRYNSSTDTWSDYSPTGTINTASNTVTIPSVTAANLFEWWVLVDQVSPLPVELLSFEAKPDGADVRLRWTTATELNNDYFTVQSSVDALDFKDIARVQGAGTSQTSRKYNYVDAQALLGRTYYRLKQTDFDGKFKFSEIRKVDLENILSPLFSIYPNPSSGMFTVYGATAHKVKSISILDSYGKVVRTIEVEKSDGRFNQEFDLTNQVSGLYIVKITQEQGTDFLKIVKE